MRTGRGLRPVLNSVFRRAACDAPHPRMHSMCMQERVICAQQMFVCTSMIAMRTDPTTADRGHSHGIHR
jgi:hypothetical protein